VQEVFWWIFEGKKAQAAAEAGTMVASGGASENCPGQHWGSFTVKPPSIVFPPAAASAAGSDGGGVEQQRRLLLEQSTTPSPTRTSQTTAHVNSVAVLECGGTVVGSNAGLASYQGNPSGDAVYTIQGCGVRW
jgi:hypothetical protein